MKKFSLVFGMPFMALMAAMLAVLFLSGCSSSSAVISSSDIPAESASPTPFEGTWSGTEAGVAWLYQFKGNTFLAQASSPDRAPGWRKGVFNYSDKAISLIHLYSLDPAQWATSKVYDWTRVEGMARGGGSFQTNRKYTLSGSSLALGNAKYTKTAESVTIPEESVFFIQENNWVVNGSNRDVLEVFNIVQINDERLTHLSNMFGTGYLPAEHRDPGTHKISFRQIISTISSSGSRTSSDITGYFSRRFEPGVYTFKIVDANPVGYAEWANYVEGLPPVPPGHIRVLILKQGVSGNAGGMDYLDIDPINIRG
jgi:hypothetical protein